MWRFILLSVGSAALIGCGSKGDPTGSVKGTITYKGQPVNGAALTLYPKSGNSVSIPVTQEGVFEAANLPEGEYTVVVVPSTGNSLHVPKGTDPAKVAEAQAKVDAAKSMQTIPIPKKYTKREGNDLKLTVAKGIQTIELVLKD